MKELSVHELKEKLDKGEAIQLIDVRDAYEFKMCHIEKALWIPLESLPSKYAAISRSKSVVVYCHHGLRSSLAVDYLREIHGFNNIYNLEGGINAWAVQVDKEMLCY